MKRQWRWVGSYWVAHISKTESGFSFYGGHIVFLLPGCTQLLSMFWEKSASTIMGCGMRFLSFFSGNVSFAGLSNSVLVGCFKFQRSVGCKTSSFLLTTAPSSLCDFLFSFALLRRSFLLTRGRVHKNPNSFVIKKWERTCGLREGGNTCSVALFRIRSSSGIPNVAAAWDYWNRRSLGRIQTMSNGFPRWLLNKYKQEEEE